MSNIFQDYLEKEEQLKRLEREVASMRNDDRLQKEMEFKASLEEVLEMYGKTGSDAVKILDPNRAEGVTTPNRQRKKRALKIYKNPHTGEILETRGGNSNVMKEWKAEYGDEVANDWLVKTQD